ncbi:MAG: glycosyltransferase family 9 protein [Helicobacter sp.]|nr:glycosyltransferase family 9 protein [Helicobacter sp.]
MKILILKLGYSETLDKDMGKVVSLGDVVRCTCVLEALKKKYEDSHISWLVSSEALPLVVDNPFIDRVLVWDEFIPFVLMREQYDMVVNLEKIHGICALADMIQAWEKVGFRFNVQSGEYDAYAQSYSAKAYIQCKAQGNRSHSIWQQILIEMVGCKWENQEYSLGYKPLVKESYDIGFNHYVGSKWPTKAMDEVKWKDLERELLKEGLSVSWQKGMNNLYEYMDWIAGCKVLVSNDSLGIHLALAMKKKVVALFGSTSGEEIYFYKRGICVYPKIPKNLLEEYKCLPCYSPICAKQTHCMHFIDVKQVLESIQNLLILP